MKPRELEEYVAEFLSEGQAMVRNGDASAFHDPQADEDEQQIAHESLRVIDSFRFGRPRVVPTVTRVKPKRKKR